MHLLAMHHTCQHSLNIHFLQWHSGEFTKWWSPHSKPSLWPQEWKLQHNWSYNYMKTKNREKDKTLNIPIRWMVDVREGWQSYGTMCAGNLLTAWSTRGVGTIAHVVGRAAELPHSLYKSTGLCSFLSTPFLFHLMPLLICTSPHCTLFHILQYKSFCGFLPL